MKNLSVTDKIRESYIEEYLESSKSVDYSEIIGKYGVEAVLYKDLPKKEMDGYPFASDYVAKDGTTYSVEQFLELDEKIRLKKNEEEKITSYLERKFKAYENVKNIEDNLRRAKSKLNMTYECEG